MWKFIIGKVVCRLFLAENIRSSRGKVVFEELPAQWSRAHGAGPGRIPSCPAGKAPSPS